MKKILTPVEAGREMEYNYWMKSKMPMVHVTVTLDISHLVRYCKRHKNVPLNAALCYCIAKAAAPIPECHLMIEGEQIVWSDSVNVQTILKDKNGKLRFCDLPTTETLEEYVSNYQRLTRQVRETCEDHFDDEHLFVGTSCVSTRLPIDVAVNQHNDSFQNLFLMWGAYKRHFFFKYKLSMSLQFHHVQINGGEACLFFENLQQEIKSL